MLELEGRRATNRKSLSHLLSPMTPEEFFAGYWGRRHLVIRRDSPGHYGDLFTFADVDRYLAAAAGNPAAKMSIGGPDGIRTMAVADVPPGKLYAALEAGRTAMLAAVDRTWPPVAELAAELAEGFEAQVKVNVYLTPAGHQGAPIHPDVQDVLVLQMEGAKDWYVYRDVVHEPVATLRYAAQLANLVSFDEEPEVAERTVLHRGDLLYLPRGLVHRAVAPPDTPSLHLTVCITPLYWVDFLKAALEVASARDPDLCRPLPHGFRRDPETRSAAAEGFRAALGRFAEAASFDDTAGLIEAVRAAAEPFPPDGHVEQLLRLDEVGPDTLLERRPGLTCRVAGSGDQVVIRFGQGRVKAPAAAREVFEFVRDARRFRVAELPGTLSENSRLVLVRRLIKDGLLRALPAADGGGNGA